VNNKDLFGIVCLLTATVTAASPSATEPLYDLVVYGDSSGAVAAAAAAKRHGRSVILVNPAHFLGGMSVSHRRTKR